MGIDGTKCQAPCFSLSWSTEENLESTKYEGTSFVYIRTKYLKRKGLEKKKRSRWRRRFAIERRASWTLYREDGITLVLAENRGAEEEKPAVLEEKKVSRWRR